MNSVEEGRRWLLDEFISSLSLALQSMLGERPAISEAPPGDAGDQLFWKQPFTTGGAAWLAAPEAVWVEIGGKTLTAAGIDNVDPATAKSTFVEILSQAFSALTRSISNRIRSEIACAEGRDTDTAPDGLTWMGLEIAIGQDNPATVRIAFEDKLAGAAGASGQPDLGDQEPKIARAALARTASRSGGTNTLDLLLDVELPVSVSFGRSQLPLKDVIKLTTGSIIELNRTISEPVEIIVNNCVIARGEVVVVEGNFGVRIHEVISRQERLRTLY